MLAAPRLRSRRFLGGEGAAGVNRAEDGTRRRGGHPRQFGVARGWPRWIAQGGINLRAGHYLPFLDAAGLDLVRRGSRDEVREEERRDARGAGVHARPRGLRATHSVARGLALLVKTSCDTRHVVGRLPTRWEEPLRAAPHVFLVQRLARKKGSRELSKRRSASTLSVDGSRRRRTYPFGSAKLPVRSRNT